MGRFLVFPIYHKTTEIWQKNFFVENEIFNRNIRRNKKTCFFIKNHPETNPKKLQISRIFFHWD